jgi:putative flippase GtrA
MSFLLRIIKFLKIRLFRFFLIGLLNTIFGYAIFSIVLFFNISHTIALLIATFLGLIFNYFSYLKYVFRGLQNKLVYYKFIFVYILIFFSNTIMLDHLTNKVMLNTYLSQFLCVFPNTLLNWLLMSFWVFNSESHDNKKTY